MNTMSEKVKKIMSAVIDVSITKEQAMEVLRVKYEWLYPYITNGVWDDHYGLYLKSKGSLLKTKCGCIIMRDSKKHDECRCDNNGENWICAGCYCGEYDEEDSEDEESEEEEEEEDPNTKPCVGCGNEKINITECGGEKGINMCNKCFGLPSYDEQDEDPKTSTTITTENLYNYIVIEEWDDKSDDGTDGFSYTQNYDLGITDEMSDKLHDKMFDEIRLNYDSFNNERSCMWVDEVKRRAKWVRGETLYGDSREKHLSYPIWWSRDKKNIGHSTWILEADGYVSFSFSNGYTMDETADTKWGNYIRPSCLYNDKNCDELTEIKKKNKNL